MTLETLQPMAVLAGVHVEVLLHAAVSVHLDHPGVVQLVGVLLEVVGAPDPGVAPGLRAKKVLGWPKRCELAQKLGRLQPFLLAVFA